VSKHALTLLIALAALPFAMPAQGLSDPTAADVAPGVQAGATSSAAGGGVWQLQFTLVAPGRRVAIINGVMVREGDVVAGARVVSIGPGNVLLKVNGRRLRVPMFASENPLLYSQHRDVQVPPCTSQMRRSGLCKRSNDE